MTQMAVQPNLFDSPLYGDVKGERSVAEFPFFALTKTPTMDPIVYEGGNVTIEVRPSSTGVATIYDKGVLLYIASLMVEKIEKGETVGQEFVFTAHDFFRATAGNGSVHAYDSLKAALERLQGTQIRTNIEAGGEGEEGFFSWLEHAKLQYVKGEGDTKRMKAVKVRLCDWMFRAILMDRRIATYSIDYFQLGPIQRRLYEIALANCEQQEAYAVDLEVLWRKVGCNDRLAKLKSMLKQIAEKDTLPEYRVELQETTVPSTGRGRPKVETTVVFRPKPQNAPRLSGRRSRQNQAMAA